jgi:1,4-alpha-glucan branching enzyme
LHRAGQVRGEPSAHLPGSAFVAFLQNHDQIGNRAMGERIAALAPPAAVRAATAIVLLAPHTPMLFMGEEFAAVQPFRYFCDFGPDLAHAVSAGRRREFARFERFADEAACAAIPDPNDAATFEAARLDWACLDAPAHRDWLAFVRGLLQLRRRYIVPHLAHASAGACFTLAPGGVLRVQWPFANGAMLTLLACLAARSARMHELDVPAAAALYAQPDDAERAIAQRRLPPWSVTWYLQHDTREGRR